MSLTSLVVGTADIRRGVAWVAAGLSGKLGIVPGQKAAGRASP
jgi:hypothetical protein